MCVIHPTPAPSINPPHTQKVRMNTLFLRIKKKPSLKNKTLKKYYAKYETSPFWNLYKSKVCSIQF